MKATLTLFALLLGLAVQALSTAKKPKIAYFSYEQVVQGIDASTHGQKQLAEFDAFHQQRIGYMEQAYQEEATLFETQSDTMSEVMKEMRLTQLAQQREIINTVQATYESDRKILEARLDPTHLLHNWLDEAIAVTAKKYKVTFINDPDYRYENTPADAIDLTAAVRKELLEIVQSQTAG